MKIWKSTPIEVIAKVDSELGVGWDTDSTINILERFIMTRSGPNAEAVFERLVREIAYQDLENSDLPSDPIKPVFKRGITDIT